MCQTASECDHVDFIHAYSPNYEYIDKVSEYRKGTLKTGKWCVYTNRNSVDMLWERIKTVTESGNLGATDSKVSTKLQSDVYSRRHSHVLCIYTKDWTDEKEVWEVEHRIRELGIIGSMVYKTDEDTLAYKYKYNTKGEICKYYSKGTKV
jgi:hypothetical protein